MYAIICLESQRSRTAVVGEDLGIVPDEVVAAMREHGLSGMYVLAIYMQDDPEQPFKPIPPGCIVSFGTHDLPTFAAFWSDDDIDERVRLDVLDEERAVVEREKRGRYKAALLTYMRAKGYLDGDSNDAAAVFRACLALLAESPAGTVLVNLKDMWLETAPQNVPGTMSHQYPNWQKRARHRLEEMDRLPEVEKALDVLRMRRPRQAGR
jgi:4-alpha-glucanotransferase